MEHCQYCGKAHEGTIEAVVLLVPLTAALCYTSIFTMAVGIPASVMQWLDSNDAFDPLLPLSVIGNIAGAYALVVLWSLALQTIRERRFIFSFNAKLGVAAGIVASACLVAIYGWIALGFGVLPPTVVALHFAYLQQTGVEHA